MALVLLRLTVLTVHYGSDKVFIVDVPFVIFVTNQQLLCLLVTQLLPQGCQQVAELSRAYEPISILIKLCTSLNLLCYLSVVQY